MSTFAALYPLPAGEQLLVLLLDDEKAGPMIQYITEIDGEMVSATSAILEPRDVGDLIKRNAAKEEARNTIGRLDQEAVKEIRRRFVRDVKSK